MVPTFPNPFVSQDENGTPRFDAADVIGHIGEINSPTNSQDVKVYWIRDKNQYYLQAIFPIAMFHNDEREIQKLLKSIKNRIDKRKEAVDKKQIYKISTTKTTNTADSAKKKKKKKLIIKKTKKTKKKTDSEERKKDTIKKKLKSSLKKSKAAKTPAKKKKLALKKKTKKDEIMVLIPKTTQTPSSAQN